MFVSSLVEGGTHQHWGMARNYGEQAARRAMEQAHREVAQQVTRTKIRELWGMFSEEAEARGTTPADLSKRVSADQVASGLPQATAAQVRIIWQALSELSARERRIHRGA